MSNIKEQINEVVKEIKRLNPEHYRPGKDLAVIVVFESGKQVGFTDLNLSDEEAVKRAFDVLSNQKQGIKKTSALALERAGGAWATPETKSIPMNEKLAFAFADILDEIWSKPWLGNATTAELLAELTARAEMQGYADYKTVEEPKPKRAIEEITDTELEEIAIIFGVKDDLIKHIIHRIKKALVYGNLDINAMGDFSITPKMFFEMVTFLQERNFDVWGN